MRSPPLNILVDRGVQRLKQMTKQKRFTLRIDEEELAHWNFYCISINYENLSEFIRDSINGLIKAKQKPSKVFIIENKEDV